MKMYKGELVVWIMDHHELSKKKKIFTCTFFVNAFLISTWEAVLGTSSTSYRLRSGFCVRPGSTINI